MPVIFILVGLIVLAAYAMRNKSMCNTITPKPVQTGICPSICIGVPQICCYREPCVCVPLQCEIMVCPCGNISEIPQYCTKPRCFGGHMKLSASQIAQYAQSAGFQGQDLVTAVAIALAESGGNPDAYNPEIAESTPEGKGSYGLWQIYRFAHKEFDNVNLFDPASNANAAFSVFSKGGFRQWSTYKYGQYQKYLEQAKEGIQA